MAERFSGTIEAGRGGGAFVVIPEKVVQALGGGSRFRVTGTLGGVAFESSTMSMGGGRVCLGVHKATRQAAGADIGDRVQIEIDRDERPREVSVPDDLAAALARDPTAQAAFEKLSFTHRREYVEWVTTAKREETRARRIAQTLDRLRGGSGPRATSE
jgi:Bacteriocin-protection, YdeI or OmpD-Associated/Domain of unknown function (DUF1905)